MALTERSQAAIAKDRLLLDRPVPDLPYRLTPWHAPMSVAIDFDTYHGWTAGGAPDHSIRWHEQRPEITPLGIVFHTNAAGGEGTILSANNWGNSQKDRTKPHYNLNAPVPTKSVPSHKRAIANATTQQIRDRYGVQSSSWWMLAVETADTGYNRAGNSNADLGPFLYDHAEVCAQIQAFESIVHRFQLRTDLPFVDGGIVTHTEPYGYGYHTTAVGKTCPTNTKKDQILRGYIKARAEQIRHDWLTELASTPSHPDYRLATLNGYHAPALPPPTPKDDDMRNFTRPGNWFNSRDDSAFGTFHPGVVVRIPAPFNAVEVGFNLTAFRATGDGYLSVWGEGDEDPGTNALSYHAGVGTESHSQVRIEIGVNPNDRHIMFQAHGASVELDADLYAVRNG